MGYKKKGNLIIDETQGIVVRRIYQDFLNGFGTFQIAKTLTKERIPMAYGGKEWCAAHIQKVLTNENERKINKGELSFRIECKFAFIKFKFSQTMGTKPLLNGFIEYSFHDFSFCIINFNLI